MGHGQTVAFLVGQALSLAASLRPIVNQLLANLASPQVGRLTIGCGLPARTTSSRSFNTDLETDCRRLASL